MPGAKRYAAGYAAGVKPWWKRADVWLLLIWTASHFVRWSRGRLWARSSDPGPWLELLWAAVVLCVAVYLIGSGAPLLGSFDRTAAAAPFGTHVRNVVLRAAVLAAVGGLYGVSVVLSNGDPVAGPLALMLTLGAVAAVGGGLEVSTRDASRGWQLAAAVAVGLLTVPGVLAAIAQARYANAVLAGATPPEAMLHDDGSAAQAWIVWHSPFAIGAGLAHAGVVLARLRRSARLVAALAFSFFSVFAASLMVNVEVEGWDAGIELVFGAGAAMFFCVLIAGSAWGADAIERWWWSPSDEESRDL